MIIAPTTLRLLADTLPTPIGVMTLVADEQGSLRAVDWVDHEDRMLRGLERQYGAAGVTLTPEPNPHGLRDLFTRYFEGDLCVLDAVPVEPAGTPFQREVWSALRAIPCGSTISYAQLATQVGRPAAVRAVGLANGANPVPIVVPCHRVIGANGSLTGYGGGMERKRWLLQHEAKPFALFS